ncbi:cytochrome b560 subunit of succinate dehydrogenase [Auriculariales sp. MPI-PUGE-AT-0066]|nr:cytochrome b560 subunit of succinate dehydrogenase [Auriculariales sp. MPI-PUGE-AT-0066]
MQRAPLGLGLALNRATLAARPVSRNPIALRNVVQKRLVQVQSMQPAAVNDILNQQRLKRPSTPHFTIYQPQLTWVASIVNRGTGVALSVLLYGFSIAYVVAPYAGMPFDSTAVVETVHQLPEWVKYAGKTLLAAPFAFHSFNGVRHLLWDTGRFLTLKGAYSTGYTMLGATAIGTVVLVLL